MRRFAPAARDRAAPCGCRSRAPRPGRSPAAAAADRMQRPLWSSVSSCSSVMKPVQRASSSCRARLPQRLHREHWSAVASHFDTGRRVVGVRARPVRFCRMRLHLVSDCRVQVSYPRTACQVARRSSGSGVCPRAREDRSTEPGQHGLHPARQRRVLLRSRPAGCPPRGPGTLRIDPAPLNA